MIANRLRNLLQTARFELRRVFGWPGLAAAVVLAVAAGAWWAAPAVESGTRELRESARLALAAKVLHPERDARATEYAQLLDTLPELFPVFVQSGDDIAAILAQARAANLTLGSAQYQIGADRTGAFTSYQVVLPVKDRYVAIRRFVALVLNNVPNAALQEIHVERPAVSGDVLEARIRFDLIYRASRP
jgi:hypothetical protein